jgi:hypothetical protein
MVPDGLTKLKIAGHQLIKIIDGRVYCSVDSPDWNLRKSIQYKVHYDDGEGPYIFSDVPADRIDLWTLDDKLKYFDWIQ